MKRFTLFCLCLLLIACEEENPLEWQAREYLGQGCEQCPDVRVSIPEASERTQIGKVVNRGLREEIIEWLDYDEERQASDIPGAIGSFEKGYQQLRQRFPDETIGWEAKIEGEVGYESRQMISLKLTGYIFTGGAHGYSSTRYLNFDAERAKELEKWELFSDLSGFEALAEETFRETHGIQTERPINSTGFMFENNLFALPENIGVEPDGLILLYNPYEIASYADGDILLRIPLDRVKPLLNESLFPEGTQ
jgi:hypothetical protein